MEITPYILKEFKPFTLDKKVAEVKSFFNKTAFSHFPIIKNNMLVGLISEIDIEGIIDSDEKEIGDFQYLFNLFFTNKTNNLLDLLKVFASSEANIIPVVDAKKNYLGYFDLIDILHLYNGTPFLNSEGTVLLLEKEIRDFSFSQLCQIVESNNGKVLGTYISGTSATSVKITLKFSAQDINEIIQSFRRYQYNVLSKHDEDYYLENLKDRSKYLQKYLNI
jgi:Mg/Co/Ni transporter MgtE